MSEHTCTTLKPEGECFRCDLNRDEMPKPGGGIPKRPDEIALWEALLAGEKPRFAGQRLGIPPRRVEYLCGKWARKGLYEWGVVHDLGWVVQSSLKEETP